MRLPAGLPRPQPTGNRPPLDPSRVGGHGRIGRSARAEELLLLTDLIDAPTAVGVADAEASDRRVMVTSIAAIVVAVVATIVLIAWTRRMYRNLVPLGARLPALRKRLGRRRLVRPLPQPRTAEAGDG